MTNRLPGRSVKYAVPDTRDCDEASSASMSRQARSSCLPSWRAYKLSVANDLALMGHKDIFARLQHLTLLLIESMAKSMHAVLVDFHSQQIFGAG